MYEVPLNSMKVEVYLTINGEAQPSRAGDIPLEFPLFDLYTADRVGGPAGPMRFGGSDGN